MPAESTRPFLQNAMGLYMVLLLVGVGVGYVLRASARRHEVRRLASGNASIDHLESYLAAPVRLLVAVTVVLLPLVTGYLELTYYQFAALYIGIIAGWRDAWSRKLALVGWLALFVTVSSLFIGLGVFIGLATWLGPRILDVLVAVAIPTQLVLTLRFFEAPYVRHQERQRPKVSPYEAPAYSPLRALETSRTLAVSAYTSPSYSSSSSSSSSSSASNWGGGGGGFGGGGASSSW